MTYALTRRNPTGNFVRDRFSRMFEDAFNDMLRPLEGEASTTRAWAPAVDVREADDALVLAFDLPGLAKEDVEITVEDGTLTVSGERQFENEENRESYHRIERTYGKFSRSFSLGRTVASERAAASFDRGVLTITLPKAEESKSRRIDIA